MLVAPALRLVDCAAHGVGDLVGVQYCPAVDVTRRAADGLNERALRAQEAFFVGVQDGHQGHLWDVQPLAQQVDTNQHVEHAQTQVADDLDPLNRLYVRVQVAHLDAVPREVLGEVLRHALGEGGDQHPLTLGDA